MNANSFSTRPAYQASPLVNINLSIFQTLFGFLLDCGVIIGVPAAVLETDNFVFQNRREEERTRHRWLSSSQSVFDSPKRVRTVLKSLTFLILDSSRLNHVF